MVGLVHARAGNPHLLKALDELVIAEAGVVCQVRSEKWPSAGGLGLGGAVGEQGGGQRGAGAVGRHPFQADLFDPVGECLGEVVLRDR